MLETRIEGEVYDMMEAKYSDQVKLLKCNLKE